VVAVNHGLYAMISGDLVLPDLMTFLMDFPLLMIELACLLAAMMRATGSVNFSLNAPACLMAILVTVVTLNVVILGW
jgi:hypothetical protein